MGMVTDRRLLIAPESVAPTSSSEHSQSSRDLQFEAFESRDGASKFYADTPKIPCIAIMTALMNSD